jgi:hypothetical protein
VKEVRRLMSLSPAVDGRIRQSLRREAQRNRLQHVAQTTQIRETRLYEIMRGATLSASERETLGTNLHYG